MISRSETSTALCGAEMPASVARTAARSASGASISHSSGPRHSAVREPSALRAPTSVGSERPGTVAGSARRSAIRVVGASSVIVTPAASVEVMAFILSSIVRR